MQGRITSKHEVAENFYDEDCRKSEEEGEWR